MKAVQATAAVASVILEAEKVEDKMLWTPLQTRSMN